MEITLVRTLAGLKVAFDSDNEKYKKLPLNEPIQFTYTRKRNIHFHRLFFCLLNMVFDNQEIYNNLEHLRKDLTIEAGYYDLRYGLHGEEIKEAKSISFTSMSEEEFSELYNRVIDVIVRHFHFGKDEILEEIDKYFGTIKK